MRCRLLAFLVGTQWAVAQDAAHPAYEALRRKDYDAAIAGFRTALATSPQHLLLRKELAYTLMKVGETEQARDEFAAVVALAPEDWRSALEYGYLASETGKVREARRVFDHLRKSPLAEVRAAAETPFRNVDAPLEEAARRSMAAIAHDEADYGAHLELARTAEQRDDPALAARHYLRAWQLRPVERALLVDVGRMRQDTGDLTGATAAFLVAARSANSRAAELAKERLPRRHPYASEFQAALLLDPGNAGLRRELGFLWMAAGKPREAESEFQKLLAVAPDDLLAMAQLGLLRLGRGDRAGALPLLERVLAGPDETLRARVKQVLDPPRPLQQRPAAPPPGASPPLSNKELGRKSYDAGFLNDAARYYRAAHEENPADPEVNLGLGYTYNMLRQDEEAIRYFDLARRSGDAKQRAEARKAFLNLRPQTARLRTTAWMFPMFSSRWHEGFGYGQVKTEIRVGKLPIRPYLSLRMVGDSQVRAGGLSPEYLSESAFLPGIGVQAALWRGLTAWAEAGMALHYRQRTDIGRAVPDYRGGVSLFRSYGPGRSMAEHGWNFETTADFVLLSRFRWNGLIYSQNRPGYTLPSLGALQWRAVWNANLVTDTRHEAWANFFDTGPGLRFRLRAMPAGMVWSLDALRGRHLREAGLTRPPVYHDLRAAVWYAFTR